MNFIVRLLLFCVLLSFPAQAQEVEVGAGLWCDTKEQVAQFITENGDDPIATLQKVNDEAKASACALSYVAMYRGQTHETVRNANGSWVITEIMVVAIGVNGGFLRVPPARYFTAMPVKEEGA